MGAGTRSHPERRVGRGDGCFGAGGTALRSVDYLDDFAGDLHGTSFCRASFTDWSRRLRAASRNARTLPLVAARSVRNGVVHLLRILPLPHLLCRLSGVSDRQCICTVPFREDDCPAFELRCKSECKKLESYFSCTACISNHIISREPPGIYELEAVLGPRRSLLGSCMLAFHAT